MADVEVAYARSFYAGAKHASGLLSGEIMAILAGPNPAEVRAGLHAALEYMKHEAIWYSANADASIAFFPHLISRTGSFLSKVCDIPLGSPIAYLVAPPMEGLVALDAALKAAAVRIAALTLPPSETNYMGAMLTGDQPACKGRSDGVSGSRARRGERSDQVLTYRGIKHGSRECTDQENVRIDTMT
jgi:ethanolamine utilization protein EutL